MFYASIRVNISRVRENEIIKKNISTSQYQISNLTVVLSSKVIVWAKNAAGINQQYKYHSIDLSCLNNFFTTNSTFSIFIKMIFNESHN